MYFETEILKIFILNERNYVWEYDFSLHSVVSKSQFFFGVGGTHYDPGATSWSWFQIVILEMFFGPGAMFLVFDPRSIHVVFLESWRSNGAGSCLLYHFLIVILPFEAKWRPSINVLVIELIGLSGSIPA